MRSRAHHLFAGLVLLGTLGLVTVPAATKASPATGPPVTAAQVTPVTPSPSDAPVPPDTAETWRPSEPPPDAAKGPPPVAPLHQPAREPRRAIAADVPGDPSVTIVDFAFRSATTTVHIGDTVTWTNQGPTDHTATAGDHSFDTGVLKRGSSARHTFRSAGTFAYICTIHPSMKGTIRVLASGTPPSASPAPTAHAPAASGGPAPQDATAPPRSGDQLPKTGSDPALVAGAGLALLGGGLLVARLTRRPIPDRREPAAE